MSSRSVLVVAAHADDEVLGCGGTIAKHVEAGDAVSVCFMTDGVGARAQGHREATERQLAAKAALAELGVTQLEQHAFPDNQMDTVSCLSLTKIIEAAVQRNRPDIVYTHHSGDLNVDHRATHEAVMTALRPQPGTHTATILTFEVMSSTEWRAPSPASTFAPDWYVDIADFLELKMAALGHYQAEMRAWPHARSMQAVEHLARYRGACVGVAAAEGFKLVRNIQ
ncbi:PIG-L deacetylase family protein [Cognatiyoonia sp. IB215446]|uniref:PIG-L deacetylase family protein n=1 Tax=Cognatiyoonia sp. IB215446 TaxID=3097355 RepID=UPI002A127DCC|nr:PIG-L deacetylase family protein [Cognatiyoonia sp. IB215446]MDX8349282.1 PIG-L deacetylase family protein [Cognatiyoonia sp. IB215446]